MLTVTFFVWGAAPINVNIGIRFAIRCQILREGGVVVGLFQQDFLLLNCLWKGYYYLNFGLIFNSYLRWTICECLLIGGLTFFFFKYQSLMFQENENPIKNQYLAIFQKERSLLVP